MTDVNQGEPVEGVEVRDEGEAGVKDPEDQDIPDEGATMTAAGATSGGSVMDHWETAMPNADATKPETMPEALGGTGEGEADTPNANPA